MFDCIVTLGRFQPIHMGHVNSIVAACQNLKPGGQVLVVVGGGNKRDDRHPIPIQRNWNLIRGVLYSALNKAYPGSDFVINVTSVADRPDWREWLVSLHSVLEEDIRKRNAEVGFLMVGKDGSTSWYQQYIRDNWSNPLHAPIVGTPGDYSQYIEYVLLSNVKPVWLIQEPIEWNGTVLSATDMREALKAERWDDRFHPLFPKLWELSKGGQDE